MSIVAILIGLPVAVNNPVPTSQVVSTIPCNLTLCVESSNKRSDRGHFSND